MNKIIPLGALACSSLLFLSGCGDEPAESGSAMFRRICSQCHGLTGKGMPNLGKDITTSDFVAAQSDDQLLAFIIEGRLADHPDNTTGVAMPPRGGDPTLKDEQIRAVIEFVRSIQITPDGGP